MLAEAYNAYTMRKLRCMSKKPELHETPNPKPVPSEKARAQNAALDKELDEGLRETFPASDPVAVGPAEK